MIAVSGKIDTSQVVLGIERMGDKKLPRAIARELKKPLRLDQRDHARAQEGPDGKWPKRKAGGRRRILGKLPAAIKAGTRGSLVYVESRAKWSGSHQEGGRVGRGAVLPARPFLWISPKMIEAATALVAERVAEAF